MIHQGRVGQRCELRAPRGSWVRLQHSHTSGTANRACPRPEGAPYPSHSRERMGQARGSFLYISALYTSLHESRISPLVSNSLETLF